MSILASSLSSIAGSQEQTKKGEQPKRTAWNGSTCTSFIVIDLFKHTFRQTFVHLSFTRTNIHRKCVSPCLPAHADRNGIWQIFTLGKFQGFPPLWFHKAGNIDFSVNVVYMTEKQFKWLPEHVCWRNRGRVKAWQKEKHRKISLTEGTFSNLTTQSL